MNMSFSYVPSRIYDAFRIWVGETPDLEKVCLDNHFPKGLSYAAVFHLLAYKKKLLRSDEVCQDLVARVYSRNLLDYLEADQ